MDFNRLDQQLRDSLADLRLSNEERDELRQLGSELSPDQVRYMRNRAFALVRELIREPANAEPALKWLEQVIKTLDANVVPTRNIASAHFSPGDDCRRKIRELCRQARKSVDICVYTISDDPLSEEILACHQRGLAVRVISDNENSSTSAATCNGYATKACRCVSTPAPTICTTNSPCSMANCCSTAASTGPAAPALATKRTSWWSISRN